MRITETVLATQSFFQLNNEINVCVLMAGVINGTAPNPVKLSEMCDHLGSVLDRPSWLPVPEVALKAVLGEGACVVIEIVRCMKLKQRVEAHPFLYYYCRFLKDKRWFQRGLRSWASLSDIPTLNKLSNQSCLRLAHYYSLLFCSAFLVK